MVKVLTMVGGVAGAFVLSQAPEFSQQYVQRLAGQVDALTTIVVDFDRSAVEAGFGREEALQQLTGTPFLLDRQADMRRTFARHARLSEDLAVLREAAPMQRLTLLHRHRDVETVTATWSDFAPAVPASAAGLVAGGVGFAAGGGVLAALGVLIMAPLRRLRAKRTESPVRSEPILRKPPVVLKDPNRPVLMGETR